MKYEIKLTSDTKDFIKEMVKYLYSLQKEYDESKKPKPIDENSPGYWYSEEGQLRTARIKNIIGSTGYDFKRHQ